MQEDEMEVKRQRRGKKNRSINAQHKCPLFANPMLVRHSKVSFPQRATDLGL